MARRSSSSKNPKKRQRNRFQQVCRSVKKATVAIVDFDKEAADRPIRIIGSGFCIHEQGIIITCEHVVTAFLERPFSELIREREEQGEDPAAPMMNRVLTPYALFYQPSPAGLAKHQLHFPLVPVGNVMTKTDFDLAMLQLHPHSAFPRGYPTLPIEDPNEVWEGMEIATCGFPLGDVLQTAIGTVTSSFTRGMVSSILPSADVDQDSIIGYQLDLTATHGNSGGPVFSVKSGKVFGVLSSGLKDVQLIKAEPINAVLRHDSLNKMVATPPDQPMID